ncbi:MAG: hypothetical protein N3A54_00785 [Patescibacteria group bacterium]|nr:hypothetical protein [Patescibacteria group bacterium]
MKELDWLLLEYDKNDLYKVFSVWIEKIGNEAFDDFLSLIEQGASEVVDDVKLISFNLISKIISVVKKSNPNSLEAIHDKSFRNRLIWFGNCIGKLYLLTEKKKSLLSDYFEWIPERTEEAGFFIDVPATTTIKAKSLKEFLMNFSKIKTEEELIEFCKGVEHLDKDFQDWERDTRLEPIQDDERAAIYQANNYYQMDKLGKGTKWCTTNYESFVDYFSQCDLYVIIPKDEKKYVEKIDMKVQKKFLLAMHRNFDEIVKYWKRLNQALDDEMLYDAINHFFPFFSILEMEEDEIMSFTDTMRNIIKKEYGTKEKAFMKSLFDDLKNYYLNNQISASIDLFFQRYNNSSWKKLYSIYFGNNGKWIRKLIFQKQKLSQPRLLDDYDMKDVYNYLDIRSYINDIVEACHLEEYSGVLLYELKDDADVWVPFEQVKPLIQNPSLKERATKIYQYITNASKDFNDVFTRTTEDLYTYVEYYVSNRINEYVEDFDEGKGANRVKLNKFTDFFVDMVSAVSSDIRGLARSDRLINDEVFKNMAEKFWKQIFINSYFYIKKANPETFNVFFSRNKDRLDWIKWLEDEEGN